jgi:hypothetical protein
MDQSRVGGKQGQFTLGVCTRNTYDFEMACEILSQHCIDAREKRGAGISSVGGDDDRDIDHGVCVHRHIGFR